MSFRQPFRLPKSRNARVVCMAVMLLAAASVITSVRRRPRTWSVDKVPIAFWAWRNHTPEDSDIRAAIEKAHAREIFLRAGQIDYQDGKLRRIRTVRGALPAGIELHLVYNGTRSLLSQLENIDEEMLAESISAAFQEDCKRAAQDRARVSGLQVDIDVPTRLLQKYEKVLKSLHARLEAGLTLSITGLPTWMQSPQLERTLTQVDFWVPQFYGTEIPERSDQFIPISSSKNIEGYVNHARRLNKPFYAGLAAYSCALLYSPSGSLITLRGDMDPALIATDSNLELVDQKAFETSIATGSEWRYVYRARADGVTDGLAMHAGDVLVVHLPSAEALRASARTVRELAGERLLGICVFRLPQRDDPATLNAEQVATALADRDSLADFRISFNRTDTQPHAWTLKIENTGTASAIGLKIEVTVDSGSVRSIEAQRSAAYETICHSLDTNRAFDRPCSQNRANLVRINTHQLRPGQTLQTTLVITTALSDVIPISIETQTDAGQRYLSRRQVAVERGMNP